LHAVLTPVASRDPLVVDRVSDLVASAEFCFTSDASAEWLSRETTVVQGDGLEREDCRARDRGKYSSRS
jgi:hypothetical protein